VTRSERAAERTLKEERNTENALVHFFWEYKRDAELLIAPSVHQVSAFVLSLR